jgi:MarR family transcriptional regulator, 2-MHQ and catechol-resistance regulon repressor
MPTRFRGAPEETLALDTWIKLSRAADSFGARLAQGGALGDLTAGQFGVLESLYHLGPLRQSEIGAKLLRSGSNITLVVDNLERDGLVRRERDRSDRRAVNVSLTDAGRELIGRIFPAHVGAIVDGMAALTPEEQAELGRLCKKLGKRGS